jgi:alkylation response protein AidB-like acyl-CoA dehydrogenase
MDLTPSDDDLELVRTVEQFLTKELSIPQLRDRLRENQRVSPTTWRSAGQLGVFGLGLAEDAGGSEWSVVQEALVFRQLGRHVAPLGFLASVLGARLAHMAGRSDLRDAISSGESPVALGVGRGHAAVSGSVTGSFDIFDLDVAVHALLYVDPGAFALVDAECLKSRREFDCLDPSCQLTEVQTEGVDALAVEDNGPEGGLRLLASLLTSSMMVGIAETTRDASAGYAKERVQFGKPIGAHQAVKHRCADMATNCEAALSLLYFAAVALRDHRDDAAFQVSALRFIATAAASENVASNIQVHGGMGYTWEHDAHIHVSRFHLLNKLFGELRDERPRFLDMVPSAL